MSKLVLVVTLVPSEFDVCVIYFFCGSPQCDISSACGSPQQLACLCVPSH